MKIFTKIAEFSKTHKLISSLAFVLLFAALCAGGYFGWKQYQYRQSSMYAFEKLKQALQPPQPSELARLIDFNLITQDLARTIAHNFSFYMAGPDQERNIRNAIQTALLQRFMEKDVSNKPVNSDENEEKALKQPLQILPNDFISQIVDSMSLRQNGPDSALITAKINNKQLNHVVTLIFALQKTNNGWIVRHLANAKEVTVQMRDAMIARHNRLREVYIEKNDKTLKKMDALLPIQSCSADAGLIGNGKLLVMMVHVIARNRGDVQVNNFNMEVQIIGKDGHQITQRLLNTAKPVAPGEDFNHRWSFELESQSPLAQNLMQGIPLQCRARWQTLGLSNSQVWHIEEVPNPDRICPIEGHDHPDGFCFTPVFLPDKQK